MDPAPKFVSLSNRLRKARHSFREQIPTHLYEYVLRDTPEEHRNALVPQDNVDLNADATLDPATRDLLKEQRARLRQLLTHEHVDDYQAIETIDKVLQSLQRVLNPAAHAGREPLYKKEVEDALALIQQLDRTLQAARAS